MDIAAKIVDASPWYDIWEAAVAIYGICARVGMTGIARNLGESRWRGKILRVLTKITGDHKTSSIDLLPEF